ncbi:MAG TPA: class I SAM-dependent methyltransferase [Streptosporangiaceae bacterium]|jgi:SAM-dependent methyltransferase
MDIRDLPGPAHQWLAKVNARHPWSHNEHFHRWILDNLPTRRRTAMDIGCGPGVLAGKLAPHFTHVTGIDRDEGMAAAASARLRDVPRVSIQRCDFADLSPAADDGGADLITMVAALHHLDLEDALTHVPSLLTPGGRLLVVGLARPDSPADLAFDMVSSAANPVMGMIKHPRPARPPQPAQGTQPAMPMLDPVTTLADITRAARVHLPGSIVRRRLFFRYTLRWDKPR